MKDNRVSVVKMGKGSESEVRHGCVRPKEAVGDESTKKKTGIHTSSVMSSILFTRFVGKK